MAQSQEIDHRKTVDNSDIPTNRCSFTPAKVEAVTFLQIDNLNFNFKKLSR